MNMRELSLNVMDIAQNSITADASLIEITVSEDTHAQTLVIKIKDNGKGMTAQQTQQVLDPFYTTRTTRKVGLGIPLFKMAAEQTGGNLTIVSHKGAGTTVNAVFHTGHVDMTPLGDINSTISILIRCNPNIDFCFIHKADNAQFMLDTRQLREILGPDVALDTPDVMEWVNGFLTEQTQILYGGATPDEITG